MTSARFLHPVGISLGNLLDTESESAPHVVHWHDMQEEMERHDFRPEAFRRASAAINYMPLHCTTERVFVVEEKVLETKEVSVSAEKIVSTTSETSLMSTEVAQGVRRVVLSEDLEDFSDDSVGLSEETDLEYPAREIGAIAPRMRGEGVAVLPKIGLTADELDAIMCEPDEPLDEESFPAQTEPRIRSRISASPAAAEELPPRSERKKKQVFVNKRHRYGKGGLHDRKRNYRH